MSMALGLQLYTCRYGSLLRSMCNPLYSPFFLRRVLLLLLAQVLVRVPLHPVAALVALAALAAPAGRVAPAALAALAARGGRAALVAQLGPAARVVRVARPAPGAQVARLALAAQEALSSLEGSPLRQPRRLHRLAQEPDGEPQAADACVAGSCYRMRMAECVAAVCAVAAFNEKLFLTGRAQPALTCRSCLPARAMC